ncbi:MAG: thrombospondin type 3 repeat-containing protein [Candidatus Paceibacteria bacterium]
MQEGLTIQQKVGAALLVIVGVLALGLGGLQLRNTIYNPLAVEPSTRAEKALAQFFDDQKTRLRKLDTDKDGLSDYQEVHVYNTSRYLKDTDSDGLTDKEEIEGGTDPNCPEGETCIQQTIQNSTTNTTESENAFQQVMKKAGQDLRQSGGLRAQSTQQRLKDLANNSDKLRQALLDSGKISKKRLDQIDDKTLKNKARDILTKQNSSLDSGSESGQQNNTTNTKRVGNSQMRQLLDQPDKLRKLLLNSGKISKEKLDKIDDKALIRTAKRILEKRQNN